MGKMDDIWIDLYAYDDTCYERTGPLAAAPARRGPLLGAMANEIWHSMIFDIL